MDEAVAPLDAMNEQIERAYGPDRRRLRAMLRQVQAARRRGPADDRGTVRLAEQIAASQRVRQARCDAVPPLRCPDELPICSRREEIVAAIREHDVIIVCGETGSGKSTQLPKFCLEAGRGIDGVIGHTQPRRIAARSVAARVAEELGVPLGEQVGYKVRFHDRTSPRTLIKLMTDGVLLAECQHDRYLSQYDALILDEAHERSLNIDFLLGCLKRLWMRRRDLKLIITSATIDAERFAQHFSSTSGPAPVIQVSGRSYPVEIRYRPPPDDAAEGDADDPDGEAMQDAVLAGVREACDAGPGDLLVFLPTERDILELARRLRGSPPETLHDQGRGIDVVPLFARLPAAEQQKVFQPGSKRRIVLATNVAESALTVPGIRYVVDTGLARISRYSARSKMQRLPIEPISQASADQRAGRCGRIAPGLCIRLFSEADYRQRERYTPPEIVRTNLAEVILQSKALGFGNVEEFPFLDAPKTETIRDGYRTLFELGAIDEKQELTPIGKRIARLPCDPRIARIVLAGHDEHCLPEILIIAAALELQDPRERPLDRQQAADEAHARFAHPDSDFLALLKLWDFIQPLRQSLSRKRFREACRQNFLSESRVREWGEIHQQLLEIIEPEGLDGEAQRGPRAEGRGERRRDEAAIHRALLTGFLSNVAQRTETGEYLLPGGSRAALWPGSGTAAGKPKWVVAAELVETSRRFLRCVAKIQPQWVEPLAAHLVRTSCSEPHWDRAAGTVLAWERVSLGGLILVPRRRVHYGPRDPAGARALFIQHALVEGEFDGAPPFFVHNRALLASLEELQNRSRRKNLLAGESARYAFYDERLPPDVYDGARLEAWLRTAEASQPRLLHMTEADLIQDEVERPDPQQFPEKLACRQMQLPLEYRFEPGSPRDGVTVVVPQEALPQIEPQRLGWLVPGLLEDKIAALIKSLPKPLRRNLVPAQETARRVVRELRLGEGDFLTAVADKLRQWAGEPITAASFDQARIPDHLRMNLKVVGADGEELAFGRDLNELRGQLAAARAAERSPPPAPPAAPSAAGAASDAVDEWGRRGLTRWDFGPLPTHVDLVRHGVEVRLYPALIDAGESVELRLRSTPEQAARDTHFGLRRLCMIHARRELRQQLQWLPDMAKWRQQYSVLPEPASFPGDVECLLAERAFLQGTPLPRTEADFAAMLSRGRERLGEAVQEVTALIGPLLDACRAARKAIESLRAAPQQPIRADLAAQFTELTPPRFLSSTPWPWLIQLPRYFRAMTARVEKLARGSLQRDLQLLPKVAAWRERLAQRRAADEAQPGEDPQWVHLRWMVEEYRVSLFAQELGTAVAVSDVRLERQWALVR